jgi:tRNA-Thr(GGU) m(6)t(6)A37 methyltransferase TsaA
MPMSERPSPYQIRPIGWVQSPLREVAEAPNQADRGAPSAWLVLAPEIRDGARDIEVGQRLLVLTWLHLARRDELATVPGDDPGGPERGVFSTRSPNRPNPIGLHPVTVLAVEPERLQVDGLEAVDGTPVIDLKPPIRPVER